MNHLSILDSREPGATISRSQRQQKRGQARQKPQRVFCKERLANNSPVPILHSLFIKIDKTDMIGEELVTQFEGILSGVFQDLFNLAVRFEQTKEEKNCQYCPYQSICSRKASQGYSS